MISPCLAFSAVLLTCGDLTPPQLYGPADRYEIPAKVSIMARHVAVPDALAHAMVFHESRYVPGLTGSAGEIGLGQIKLTTAFTVGYAGSRKELYEIDANLFYSLHYLKRALSVCQRSIAGRLVEKTYACALYLYNRGLAAKRFDPKAPYVVKAMKAYRKFAEAQ